MSNRTGRRTPVPQGEGTGGTYDDAGFDPWAEGTARWWRELVLGVGASSRASRSSLPSTDPELIMEDTMDRNEKKELRERIGHHLDVSRARLTDAEAETLGEFIENYDDYKGTSTTRKTRREGWSSDGKYTRDETVTETFTEEPGIRTEYSYRDDDGQTGSSTSVVSDARGVLDWFKGRK